MSDLYFLRPPDNNFWAGWIPGNREDRDHLIKLGVRGLLIYKDSDNSGNIHPPAREKTGHFEHCWCDRPTLNKLTRFYPAFIPGTFTKLADFALVVYLSQFTDVKTIPTELTSNGRLAHLVWLFPAWVHEFIVRFTGWRPVKTISDSGHVWYSFKRGPQ